MKCVVIGGGPAGMFCSGLLAHNGNEVTLVERNEKLGKKLYITGKGRCNITNSSDRDTLLSNVISNPKFAISALSKFTPEDTIAFFESNGVPLKIERGNRVFPVSDKSSDIIKCLERFLKKNNVSIMLDTKVIDILTKDNNVVGVKTDKGEILSDIVIIATGGMSYSQTGSTGDGYKWAKKLGHSIVELRPGLSALIVDGLSELSGLSLKNVEASVLCDNKVLESEFGEMLFTHKGVSGPIILSLSSKINKYYANNKFSKDLILSIDLKPAVNLDTLSNRLIKDLANNNKMEIKNLLSEYMPKSLIQIVLKQTGINPFQQGNSITKEQRQNLLETIKGIKFSIKNIEKFDQAIITSGGIDIKDVNPKDMQSKLFKGLYFIGEVLDVDALTGGFNIQIALSTAYAMAQSIK